MVIDVPFFKAEAGSRQALRGPCVSFASQLVPVDPFKVSHGTPSRSHASGGEHVHFFRAVIASTGWSQNDDVFIVPETVSADVPNGKPLSCGLGLKVVGHVESCGLMDKDGKVLSTSTGIDNLPPVFHLVADAVVFAEVTCNPFLGMDCIFRGFDYAIGSIEKFRVVRRTGDTAHLTRHLRAYGGTGLYQGERIGRVLKYISFSPQCLVKRPENAVSIMLSEGIIPAKRSLDQAIADCFGDTPRPADSKLKLPFSSQVQRDILRFFDYLTDED
jgi:hypothetical protein